VTRYLVLLRGVNVSGHNKVPMAELRSSLSDAGFDEVSTYIQSGNIAVDSDRDPEDVAAQVVTTLAESFDVYVPVVVVAQKGVDAIIDTAPFAPGADPTFQVIYFAQNNVDVAGIAEMDPDRWPGDVITGGINAVYVSYKHGQGKSKVSLDQLERAAGTTLTGRNLRTVAKLQTL
jgi:uncharacterized protein (DUF1697 family)